MNRSVALNGIYMVCCKPMNNTNTVKTELVKQRGMTADTTDALTYDTTRNLMKQNLISLLHKLL